MWGFSAKRILAIKDQILTIEDGNSKRASNFGNISTGQNSLKLGGPLISRKCQKSEKSSISRNVRARAPRKVLPELAQCSIQSRIHRSSGAPKSITSFDIGGIGSGGPIFLRKFGRNFQPWKIAIEKATAQVFFKSQSGNRTLTRNNYARPLSPSPSGGDRPLKVPKQNEQRCLKHL